MMKKPPLDYLTTELRDLMIDLGRGARGAFGTRDTQAIFDENLEVIERLYQAGASHAIVSEILKDIGVTASGGSPLPTGTISSAISRSRQRAVLRLAAPGIARPVAAVPGSPLQATADRGSVPQHFAMQRNSPASNAGGARNVPAGAQTAPNHDAAARAGAAKPMPAAASTYNPQPSSTDVAATRGTEARNSAEILNKLRSASDGET